MQHYSCDVLLLCRHPCVSRMGIWPVALLHCSLLPDHELLSRQVYTHTHVCTHVVTMPRSSLWRIVNVDQELSWPAGAARSPFQLIGRGLRVGSPAPFHSFYHCFLLFHFCVVLFLFLSLCPLTICLYAWSAYIPSNCQSAGLGCSGTVLGDTAHESRERINWMVSPVICDTFVFIDI